MFSMMGNVAFRFSRFVLIAAFLSSLLPASPEAIPPYYRFQDVVPLFNGRPVLSIAGICSDDLGFLWFGTNQGLFRYDGYGFTRFGFEPGREDSLSNDDVFPVIAGRDGALWIGTNGGGLNRFDPAMEKFCRFRLDPAAGNGRASDIVLSIAEDSDGWIWAGTRGRGLFRLDPRSGRAEPFPLPGGEAESGNVFALCAARNGFLWAGTHGGGVFRVEVRTHEVRRFQHEAGNPRSLGDDRVWALIEDQSGRIWAGTYGQGLSRFDNEEAGFTNIPGQADGPSGLRGRNITALVQDTLGRIWAGTHNDGIRILDPATGGYQAYRHDPADLDSLSDNGITALCVDKAGVMWIGTTGGSVVKTRHSAAAFLHFRGAPYFAAPFGPHDIRAILRGGDGSLWIGSEGGLNRLEVPPGPKGIESPQGPARAFFPGQRIRALAEDREGALWIGTADAGLIRLWPKTGGDRRYRAGPGLAGGLSSDRITAVLSSRVDPTALWAGTERGLNRIDIRTGRIEYWRRRPDGLADDHIRALAESRDGTIWIGTENRGLHRLDPNTGRFMRLPSSPEAGPSDGPVHRTITAIFEDRNGLLWVGTEAGLSRFDQKTKLWIHLNEQAGLPGPSVRGILEDDAGRIWVSTDGGVVRINPGTGILGEFDLSDGLQAEEFNFGAVVRDSSGRLLFGGPNGLNVVDPGRIERSFPSVVVLTRFTRSGRSAPSARPLSRLNSIGIRMNEFVVLEFAALSFAGPGRLHYAGKLEGRDREWFALGPHREIELANLNPGRYILHVGIPSFAGGRIVNESTWSIRVVRPLRASPVFWLVILGGAGAALAAFFRSRRKRSIRPERILIPDDEAVLLRVAEKFRLSGREIELLKLILGGQTNDEISRTLFISPSTVRNHVSNIYQKLHVRSRIQLLNLLKKHSGDLDPN